MKYKEYYKMNPTHLKVPWKTASNLAHDFERHNYTLYLVGGAVREILLGTPQNVSDLDFTTDADMDTIDDILLSKDIDTFRIRSEIPVQRAKINRFRVDVSRHHVFTDSGEIDDDKIAIEKDLSSRDFTINAMALRLSDNKLIDIFGGVEDMRKRVIRTPANPAETFRNDPVRILRAVRFASQMQYTIEENTMSAIHETCHLLRDHDTGRAMAELWKILEEDYSETTCEWLAKTDTGDIMFGDGFSKHHKMIAERINAQKRRRIFDSKASEMWWPNQTDYGVFGDWNEKITALFFYHPHPRVFKEADQYRKEKSQDFNFYDILSGTLSFYF